MFRILIILSMIAMLIIPASTIATKSVVSVQGRVYTATQTVQSSDAVQNLPANIIGLTMPRATAVYITCENAHIRWTVGEVDPVREALPTVGLGHILYSTYGLRIANGDWIRDFRFTSETADTPARLQITAEYDSLN